MLKALTRSGVEYLLVGGYAMRYYGATRCAADVDLLAGRATENARKLLRAIEQVVGHPPGFSEAMLAQPRQQVSFRYDGYNVSILTSIDGLSFQEAYEERAHAVEKGAVIPVASRRDLIFIKRVAAGLDPRRREKELRDIAFLESHEPSNHAVQRTGRSRCSRSGR